MKQHTIEMPDGYKAVETKISNNIILVYFTEEEKYEPKNGDMVYGDGWIILFRKRGELDESHTYASLNTLSGKLYISTNKSKHCGYIQDIERPATPEEQKQLYDALAKEGKMWVCSEKKIIDIPKKGDILKWTGFDPFVGVVSKLEELYPCYATMVNPSTDRKLDKMCCWMPNLVEPTESEKQECLANLKKLGKRIDENGDIVDVKLLVPDHIEIYRPITDFNDGDGLYIRFNDQLLYYNSGFHVWGVCPLHNGYNRVKCELVKCNLKNLKPGDTFLSEPSGLTSFGQSLYNYNKYLKDGRFAHFSADDDGIIVRDYPGDVYKLILVND